MGKVGLRGFFKLDHCKTPDLKLIFAILNYWSTSLILTNT